MELLPRFSRDTDPGGCLPGLSTSLLYADLPRHVVLRFGPEIVSAGFYNKGSGFGGWTQPSPYTNATLTNVPTDANFKYTAAAVPEPSSILLSLLGGAVLGACLRRKRS